MQRHPSQESAASIPIGRRFLIFVQSWTSVFVFGLIVCGFLMWLTGQLLIRPDGTYEETVFGKYVVIYGILACGVLTIVLKSLQRGGGLFRKYARWALRGGLALNIIFLLAGIIGLGVQNAGLAASSSTCSLDQQLRKAQAATVPIATDLGTGTAFAIGNNTTLLTAYHVIEGADRVYANYTTGEVPVTIVATAPQYDIALLSIAQPTQDFMTLTSNYKQSDPLYAMGYPGNAFTAGHASLSAGIVARVLVPEDMKLNSNDAPEGLELIQTDAAINGGNSGGPAFVKCGVAGVVTAKSDSRQLQEYGIVSEEGISFAVSSQTVARQFKLPLNN